MKQLCKTGYKISDADKKAFEHYLLESPKEWAQKALEGMINKAIKTIYRDWIDVYKETSNSITANISDIIEAIVVMPAFKKYNTPSLEVDKPQRDDACSIEIWNGGFEVQDYEYTALQAFYKDPEQTLYDLMENKIAKRKKAFLRDCEPILLNDPSVTTISCRHDKFIQEFCKRPDYKNRKQKEEEYAQEELRRLNKYERLLEGSK